MYAYDHPMLQLILHTHTNIQPHLSNIASKDFCIEWKQRTFSKFELPENVQVYYMHGVLVNIFRHRRRISSRTFREINFLFDFLMEIVD